MNVTDKMKRIAITSIASLGLISPIVLSSITPVVSANSKPSVIRISQNKVSTGNYTKQIKHLQRQVNIMNRLIKKDKSIETKRNVSAIKSRIRANVKAAKVYQAKKNKKGALTLAKRIKNNRKALRNTKKSDVSRQAYANKVLREYKQLTNGTSKVSHHSMRANAVHTKPIRRAHKVSLKAHQRNLQKYINDMNMSIRKDQRYLQHRNRVATLRKRKAASHARYIRVQENHIHHLQEIATKLHAKLSRLNREVRHPVHTKKHVAIRRHQARKSRNTGVVKIGARIRRHVTRKARNTGIVRYARRPSRREHHGSYVRVIKPSHSTNNKRTAIVRKSSTVHKYHKITRRRVPRHESKADKFFDSLDMAPSKDMNINTGAFAPHKEQPTKSYSGNWIPYSAYRKSLKRAHSKRARLARRKAAHKRSIRQGKRGNHQKFHKRNRYERKSHKRAHDMKIIKKSK